MTQFRDWNLECKVYIGNLGSRATKDDIEAVFSRYGPIRNVWVARNPPGFAFVEFEDSRDAEDAVKALDGTRICGARVRVEMSHGRTRNDRGRRRNPPPPPPPQYHRRRYSRSRSRSLSPRYHHQRGRSDSRERR
uniref:Rbp1-like RNA-binding protein PB n=1 Tax=Pelinobius muticus TaxID=753628 RepID=D5J6Z2_PELMU|nr:rbp1-like RNA-binding protein PB [Pelinobius muticus]